MSSPRLRGERFFLLYALKSKRTLRRAATDRFPFGVSGLREQGVSARPVRIGLTVLKVAGSFEDKTLSRVESLREDLTAVYTLRTDVGSRNTGKSLNDMPGASEREGRYVLYEYSERHRNLMRVTAKLQRGLRPVAK